MFGQTRVHYAKLNRIDSYCHQSRYQCGLVAQAGIDLPRDVEVIQCQLRVVTEQCESRIVGQQLGDILFRRLPRPGAFPKDEESRNLR